MWSMTLINFICIKYNFTWVKSINSDYHYRFFVYSKYMFSTFTSNVENEKIIILTRSYQKSKLYFSKLYKITFKSSI